MEVKMNYIIRRDPFREIMNLRSTMDRMFDDTFFGPRSEWQPFSGELALDVAEKGDEFVIKASVPGLSANDLDISFSGRTLTIKGEYKVEEEKEDVTYHLRERRYGSFARSLTLPTPVNADGIEARFENGVLTMTLPKSEEVKPKRIAISGGEKNKMIEGKVKDIAHKN
jgi:HSP20 family protein